MLPMLADFSLRLSCGLAVLLLLTSWRLVPPAFFRTQFLIILGLLSLATLDASRTGAAGVVVVLIAGTAVLSYIGAVAWGLGLPRLGVPVAAFVALLTSAVLVGDARSASPAAWALNGGGRVASALLLGSTLTAMLLGHYYLTSPAMSIDPLKRFVKAMAGSLVCRAGLAACGLALWAYVGPTSRPASPLFIAVRWGMGLAGPALATWMAWKTVEIRSTQSATGILYIAMTLVLFGELTAMVLTRETGMLF